MNKIRDMQVLGERAEHDTKLGAINNTVFGRYFWLNGELNHLALGFLRNARSCQLVRRLQYL